MSIIQTFFIEAAKLFFKFVKRQNQVQIKLWCELVVLDAITAEAQK